MKFTDEQLKILDGIKPYVDFQYVEERKGRCQSYPVIHISESCTYWCVEREELLPPPAELIGDWILTSTYDEEYTDWKEVRDSKYWKRAEYKAVEVMTWVAV